MNNVPPQKFCTLLEECKAFTPTCERARLLGDMYHAALAARSGALVHVKSPSGFPFRQR